MKEQEKIELFYQKIFKKKGGNLEYQIVTGIFAIPFFIILMIPYAIIQDKMLCVALLLLIGMFIGRLYLVPYVVCEEGKKKFDILRKLPYVPIDRKEIKNFRAKKFISFQSKLFLVAVVGQIVFTIIFCRKVEWQSIGYAVTFGFVWPILCNLPYAYWGI